jgi:hypothetical protein
MLGMCGEEVLWENESREEENLKEIFKEGV